MANDWPRAADVLIAGGGASGVLMAAHLLRQDSIRQVVLCERADIIAAGIAYGTEQLAHLLNVPAGRMSAFPEDPDHFYRWLSEQRADQAEHGWSPASFAPRRVYRDYLRSLLDPYLPPRGSRSRLVVRHDEVVDLRETAHGIVATMVNGAALHAGAAIVATGNEPPPLRQAPRQRHGWHDDSTVGLAPDAAVGIIGTGLTMVDSVVSLLEAGHVGPIIAVSRRGLVPRPHGAMESADDAEDVLLQGGSALALLRWVRRRVATQPENWRGVVDGLRPHTQMLWQGLPAAEKRRALRHARAWWDVHRHRMAPEIHARLAAAQASGQFAVIARRILSVDEDSKGITLRLRQRGTGMEEAHRLARLIDCRGLTMELNRTRNPLLRELLDGGTIRPGALGLGVDVTSDAATIGASGKPSDKLYAIGPITAGTFWEIIAIPDIRLQAAQLAERLAGRHHADTAA